MKRMPPVSGTYFAGYSISSGIPAGRSISARLYSITNVTAQ